MRRGRCQEALGSLQEAVRLQAALGLKLRTYGLDFVDYFPYYQQGVCYCAHGRLRLRHPHVQRSRRSRARSSGNGALYAELLTPARPGADEGARTQTAVSDKQRAAKRAAEEVERLRREGDELHQDGTLGGGAGAPGGGARRWRSCWSPPCSSRSRTWRGASAPTSTTGPSRRRAPRASSRPWPRARRLLDEGRAAEARDRASTRCWRSTRSNAVALEGKREAQEHILARDHPAGARRRPARGQGAPRGRPSTRRRCGR